MNHVTYRLTAKNRDQLRNPTLGNRVWTTFNACCMFATGPSLAVDTACATGLYVIDHAVRSIRSGQCDAAIVGAANVILHPRRTRGFYKVGVLSPDGTSKSFDASGH